MIRACRQCGRMVDFDEPWCDHETMEESAWIDIVSRQAEDVTLTAAIEAAAKELKKELDK